MSNRNKENASPLFNVLSDPFSFLGPCQVNTKIKVRALLPGVISAKIVETNSRLRKIEQSDFFESEALDHLPAHYQIEITTPRGRHQYYDPYCFDILIADYDLHLFSEGKHQHIYRILGSHLGKINGITGCTFAVWAPNAQRVSVVADFNQWDGRIHPMRHRHGYGVWELFIPGVKADEKYKYEISSPENQLLLKSDPYARKFELRPATASVTKTVKNYPWQDKTWVQKNKKVNWQHSPMAIYEVHLGSWRRTENNQYYNYREIAHQLVEYVTLMGFTHLELMPITEYPFEDSWGYQVTGYYASTCRYGNNDDFKYFIDYCHQHNIGVILDWVPAHFPKDAHGLAQFDGTSLYEHADPRQKEQQDWGTLIFNYGRNEVKNFLLANAVYWLEEFHLDGLRVDAVASMLYLDFSKTEGEWLPNQYGGNENLEAVDFLKTLNQMIHSHFPSALIIAEESTAWPQVTGPTWLGGLGFAMKWNMGWMHDSFNYLGIDPIFRQYNHQNLTFGMMYNYNENFVIALSHDEVVHGKSPLLYKMHGDSWQQFANLRCLYVYLYSYPGKKLLFMGNEIAETKEWDHNSSPNWALLKYKPHSGIQQLIKDLNRLYQNLPALHYYDFEHKGFHWIDCHDTSQSILAYCRKSIHHLVIIVLNFTPVVRENYRLGVPKAGQYQEILNSDSVYYHGSNVGNYGSLHTTDSPYMGYTQSLELTLPPLAGIILQFKDRKNARL